MTGAHLFTCPCVPFRVSSCAFGVLADASNSVRQRFYAPVPADTTVLVGSVRLLSISRPASPNPRACGSRPSPKGIKGVLLWPDPDCPDGGVP